MVEVVDNNTGEVRDVERIEEALNMVERPPYWRRTKLAKGFYIEGESDKEFEQAFFDAQGEIGPVIWADSENEFNKSRYASLGGMLSRIQPILHKYRLSIKQGAGKINTRNDLGGPKAFVPVWLQLKHVDTLQWECAVVEMPLNKFDNQSYKGAVTYGRRTVIESYFSLAPTDEDGVLASHQLTPEALDQMTADMIEKIIACEKEADLRKWLSENKQQFEMLGPQREEQLKQVWQNRLSELKVTKGTKKVAN